MINNSFSLLCKLTSTEQDLSQIPRLHPCCTCLGLAASVAELEVEVTRLQEEVCATHKGTAYLQGRLENTQQHVQRIKEKKLFRERKMRTMTSHAFWKWHVKSTLRAHELALSSRRRTENHDTSLHMLYANGSSSTSRLKLKCRQAKLRIF
jgi:hypothetical protein